MMELDASEVGTIDEVVQIWKNFLPKLDVHAFSLQLKLYQINLVAGRIYNRIANDFGINDIDVSVLMIVRREIDGRPARPSDLWRQLSMRPSAITYRLDRLYELGLIERAPDTDDRRAQFLRLTDKGLEAVNTIVSEFNLVTAERLVRIRALGGDVDMLDRQLDLYLKAWTLEEGEMPGGGQ